MLICKEPKPSSSDNRAIIWGISISYSGDSIDVLSPPLLRLPQTRDYKIIVISDLHFPRRDSHPKYLLEFLLHNTSDVLIFLGDTHEGYDPELKEFHEMHMRVMDLIAARQQQGGVVIDIPGNHDSYKRQPSILGHSIFGKEYWNNLLLDSALGKTLLFHGDAVDKKLSKKFDKAAYNISQKIAIGTISLMDVASALEGLADRFWGGDDKKTNNKSMEQRAIDFAVESGAQAILNGHSHKPATFSPVKGRTEFLYGNTGAWVGGLATAMVMSDDGEWRLIRWNQDRRGIYAHKPEGVTSQNLYFSFRDKTRLEIEWHRLTHQIYINSAIENRVKDTIENIEKVRKKLVRFYDSLQEERYILSEKEAAMSANTEAKPIPKPKVGISFSSI